MGTQTLKGSRGERGELAPGANWHPTCFCSRVCCQPMAMMYTFLITVILYFHRNVASVVEVFNFVNKVLCLSN